MRPEKPMTSTPPASADRGDSVAAARGPAAIPTRPAIAGAPSDTVLSRRTALKMMSATALLSVGGCTRKPERRIISMVERVEYQLPGKPLYYATTWTNGPWPYGLMVRAVDGRPVKVEGLPDHPLNKGRSNATLQASLLSLYDPARLRKPQRSGEDTTFEAADAAIVQALSEARSTVLVTRASLGPAERAIVDRFLAAAPGARHLVHESVHDGNCREAWRALHGGDGVVMPDLAGARVVFSLDADFLGTDGDTLRLAGDFARTRRVEDATASTLSRLYVAESGMTVTGTNADHRLPLRPAGMLELAEALRAAVGGSAGALGTVASRHGLDGKVLSALAEDLRGNRGRAVAVAGPHLPAAVHASIALLNRAIGAEAELLRWNPEPHALPVDAPADIVAAFESGPDVAILLGVDPVYDLPGAEAALGKVRLAVGHGLTANETVAACAFALPSAHNFESWNDAAPVPGVKTLCQPLIAPLFGGRQEAESLLRWTKALAPEDARLRAASDMHDYVRLSWQQTHLRRGGPRAWEEALRKGLVGSPTLAALPRGQEPAASALIARGIGVSAAGDIDLVVRPHTNVGDGRDAGIAWLLELPEPTSKLVWDNAAVMSPRTAKRIGVAEGDWVTVEAGGGQVKLPVLVQSGVATDVVVAHLGWGRKAGAGLGNGVGVNVAPLLTAGRTTLGASVKKAAGAHYPLVRTQQTFDDHGREHVRYGTKKEYEKANDFAAHRVHVPPLDQIDQAWDYSKGHKWALAIDLNQCTGCQACVIACQSENNISVVGKEETAKSRDMGWIRLDRYEEVHGDDPASVLPKHQPMLCQHCDNAPCETVCPVNATAHSPEGLNEQVYNRCVGTRYCLNNCPYKVRRFNFFSYSETDLHHPVQELAANPNVTVRSRGVMEKCTFCIQRINEAKFDASNRGVTLADGAITPACEQACPSAAIAFGDANLSGSRVALARESDLAYHVLEELNVRPNVTYLARVRNLHPSLDDGLDAGGKHADGRGGH
jgi:molybdopterin-containing oxidoreductase family iron-sulfur binding subunit